MKVLVTGSAGFIGQHVDAELRARGHTGVAFDRSMTGGRFTGRVDVRNIDMLRFAAGMGPVDAIVNLAGALGTHELIGAERSAADVNILGAVNVYDVAASMGIPVVQIGTGHKGQLNPYAITKACAEDLGLARAQWNGEKIAVVRAYHVYGPGQKPPPPHGTSPVRKIIPSLACRAMTGMPVEIYGSGHQVIDLVYAADVAKALVDALDGPYGRVTEAGTGVGTTVNEAAKQVVALTGSPSEIVHVPMRRGEPKGATVMALHGVCQHPWPYGLDETLDYLRQFCKEA